MRSSVLSLPFLAALILLLQVQPDEATNALTIGATLNQKLKGILSLISEKEATRGITYIFLYI